MDVPGNDDFLVRTDDAHDHRHDGTRRPLDREECLVGAERLGSEALGLGNRRFRMMKVVERGDVDQVDLQGVLADEVTELRVHSFPAFMARDVERDRVRIHVREQRVKERCLELCSTFKFQ